MPSNAESAAALAKDYYAAMVAGDAETLRRIFEPRAPIVGYYEGAFQWQSLDDFISEAQELVGEHGAETSTVNSVTVDGSIASVTVGGRYAGLWIVDHLSLVRSDGNWLIAAKTFHVAD